MAPYHRHEHSARTLAYQRRLLGADLRILVHQGDVIRVDDRAPAVPRTLPMESDSLGYVCVRLDGRLIRLKYILPPSALA